MPQEIAQPKDWSVQNYAFVGYVLVDMPPEPNQMGVMQKPKEGWMPFAIDLRPVNELKQAEYDQPERCALYHHGTHIATVNCSFEQLIRSWIQARNLFDEPSAQQYTPPACGGY